MTITMRLGVGLHVDTTAPYVFFSSCICCFYSVVQFVDASSVADIQQEVDGRRVRTSDAVFSCTAVSIYGYTIGLYRLRYEMKMSLAR